MGELFGTFWKNLIENPGLSGGAFLLLTFWVNYNRLLFFGKESDDKKRDQRRRNTLNTRLHWLKQSTFEQRYLDILGSNLQAFAERWTHDAERIHHPSKCSWCSQLFGIDPFTEGSYLLVLRLALVYPALGFFCAWVADEGGILRGWLPLPGLTGGWLIFLIATLGLYAWLCYKFIKSRGWLRLAYGVCGFSIAVTVAVAVGLSVAATPAGAIYITAAGVHTDDVVGGSVVIIADLVAVAIASFCSFGITIAAVAAAVFTGTGAVAVACAFAFAFAFPFAFAFILSFAQNLIVVIPIAFALAVAVAAATAFTVASLVTVVAEYARRQ